MSISLQKGQKVSLTKENAGLRKIVVGLGWDEAKKSGGFLPVVNNGLKSVRTLNCSTHQVYYGLN